MELRKYLSELPAGDRSAFALRCRTTVGHLRNVMYGYRPCSPELAADIERASAGAVQRPDMRPTDWHRIWPELVGVSGLPVLGAAAEQQSEALAEAQGAASV